MQRVSGVHSVKMVQREGWPPSAVATATSTGTAKAESDLRSAQQPAEPPPMTAVRDPRKS